MINAMIKLFVVLLVIVASMQATAAEIDATTLSQLLISKMAAASATLSSTALVALGGFATLQLFIKNFGLLKSGADIESVIAKFAASVIWIGVCIYIILKGPEFISGVGNQFFSIPGLSLPTVGTIMSNTAKTAGVIGALAVPIGVASNTLGMFMVYLLLGTIGIGCLFAFKIFMLQLELGLVVMLSPLSFSFLGLDALKDQGIAPLKSLISLIYRTILIGVILSAFTVIDDSVKAVFSSLSMASIVDGVGAVMDTLVSALGAYLLLAYLLYKSDSIAASLASGSTSMGTADVAQAAALGAAAGAATAAGGAATTEGATKAASSVSDLMKKLSGNSSGPSVSNAGGSGSGSSGHPGAASALMSTSLVSPPGMPSGSGAASPDADPFLGTAKQKGGFNAGPGGQSSDFAKSPQPVPSSQQAGGSVGDGSVGFKAQDTGVITPSNGDFASALGGGSPGATSATKQPDASAVPGDQNQSSQSKSPDSAAGAGLGGSASQQLEKNIADLAQQIGKMGDQSKAKPSFLSELARVNEHIAHEKATTQVSINTHHSD